jgi:N-acetylglucosamine-6-sulfatase
MLCIPSLVTALLLTSLATTSAGTPAAKPNIVFIFSDDHAVQAIGAYGARLSEFCKQQGVTPNLDKLADQGGVFVNSFCGNSLCSPSRASVLTGLLSHANGVMHLEKPITPGLWTFLMGLKDCGYQTAAPIGPFPEGRASRHLAPHQEAGCFKRRRFFIGTSLMEDIW